MRVALALSLASPAAAAIGAQGGPGQQSLQRVAGLSDAASGSGSLESGTHGLATAYDNSGSQPSASPTDASRPIPSGLQQPPPQQGAHFAQIPQPTGSQITPDQDTSSKKKDDAKKKDLQRMAIGGAGGALVLAVFGFIFGGPIGALVMGAIGFGAFAGITYLNNHPI